MNANLPHGLQGQKQTNGKPGGNAGVNVQQPRLSGIPQDVQAPMKGESFRGNQPGGTKGSTKNAH